MLRPANVQTYGVVNNEMGGAACVGMVFQPPAGDPNFESPVTVLLRSEDVETLIDLLRKAQAHMPKNRGNMS
jgi:hypothetical protein